MAAVLPVVKRTWLDRFVGAFSPQAELHRLQSRASTAALEQRYAHWPDTNDGWSKFGSGPDGGMMTNRKAVRERARELVRTNPNVALGIEEWETNAAPVQCRAMVDIEDQAARLKVNEKVDLAWWEWGQKADFAGLTDWDGLQRMVVRALQQDGMVLAQKVRAPVTLGVMPNFQVQLLEVDHLDESQDRHNTNTGVTIVGGIQYGRDGRYQGAWLLRHHPGSIVGLPAKDSIFVPAKDLLIIFDPQRPGSHLGFTRLLSVLQLANDLDQYEEAKLKRAQVEACMVASVTDANAEVDTAPVTAVGGTATDDGSTVAPFVKDSWGRRIEEFGSGMIMYPPPGRSLEIHQPTGTGGHYEYTSTQQRRIAAGMGLTAELLTGDLSQVNFSSSRIGQNGFKRRVKRLQDMVLLPQFLRRVFHDWFVPEAQNLGLIPQGKIWSKWTPPRWESVQPLDDAKADQTDMRTGAATFQQVCAARGLDPMDQLAEIAEWNKIADSLGLKLDSDPRYRTSNGSPADVAAAPAADSQQGDEAPPGDAEKERAERPAYLRKVK